VVALDEGRPLEKIEGKIPTDAELRENGQICAAGFGLGGKSKDASRVAFEVTDSGVELSEGDFHSG